MAFTICWFNMLGRIMQCIGHTNMAQERQGWYLLMAWPRANHFPFLCLSLPTHHLPCLFRSQALWGSPLSCLVFLEVPMWDSLPCHWIYFSRSCIQHRVDKVTARNGMSRKLSSKKGQIARMFRLQGAQIWRVREREAMITMLNDPSVCLSVHRNLILSPLDSVDFHSHDWFQGHEDYRSACTCFWTWDLMQFSSRCLCWRLLWLSGVQGLSVLMTLIKNVTSSRAKAHMVSENIMSCQAGAKFSTTWWLHTLN